MKKQVWYGFSREDNRVHFFDTDQAVGKLEGTGSFTVNGGEINGLNIEQNVQQGGGQRQQPTA